MAYSVVDPITDFDYARFPIPVEAALFVELVVCCQKQRPELYNDVFSLYMFSGDNTTREMCIWANRNGIAFNCPVCCGSKVRQCWIQFGGELSLLDMPCYCCEVIV